MDLNTYSGLSISDREEIDAYQYYEEENDAKRNIKILDRRYINIVKKEVENIFASNSG